MARNKIINTFFLRKAIDIDKEGRYNISIIIRPTNNIA